MPMNLEEQQQLLTHILKENFILQAQLTVLQRMFVAERSARNEQPLAISAAQYKKDVRETIEQLIANHPMLDQPWRKILLDNIEDIPGIDL